jgi:protein-tyrosine phosphatase
MSTGNMDHVAWVTMTDDGPIIGNLVLNGILDKRGAVPALLDFLVNRPRQITSTGQSLGIASVPNLRDLGGYTTSDGRIVAAGLVYRSNQLSRIPPGDMEMLAALRLERAYDLRTAEERKYRPGELPRGVNYVWLDVLADSPQAGPAQLEKLMQNPKEANAVLGGGKVEAGFQQSYREFVSLPSAKAGFRRLFLELGDQEQLPALFHCTTGKDRTGWAAAALLTLLGVPKDKVVEDYLRSNDYIIPAYQNVIDAFVEAGGDPAIPTAILGVKKEYLDAAFDEMKTKYGTIEKYFSEGLGIDAAQQKALRDLYLSQE